MSIDADTIVVEIYDSIRDQWKEIKTTCFPNETPDRVVRELNALNAGKFRLPPLTGDDLYRTDPLPNVTLNEAVLELIEEYHCYSPKDIPGDLQHRMNAVINAWKSTVGLNQRDPKCNCPLGSPHDDWHKPWCACIPKPKTTKQYEALIKDNRKLRIEIRELNTKLTAFIMGDLK